MGETELWDKILAVVRQVWDFELYKSGDQTVELNQLLIALVIVCFGIVLSKRIASAIGRRIGRLGKIDSNTVYLLQKLFSYALITVVVLMALPMAGIPITILTVLGGAFAIGIGFGAQNTFNNLISGLILMFEQPIRIGDIVELENAEGRIADIGGRCVRIRRSDGVDVLMPNSFFIEQPVVNWTLLDSDVRGVVTLGVAYGSPVEKVRDILLAVAREHEKIHSHPEPVVLFDGFGDNTLDFSLRFWTRVNRPLNLRTIQSDLRFRLEAVLRENGIEIAFPQRDIHFDSDRPLQVTLHRD